MTRAHPAHAERYPFELDRFQLDAIDAIDAGDNTVVAAPTGSGKTVIAEYAFERAIAAGQRGFYTAPVKALSNQKYRDLVDIHGPARVGLLTGDNSINGDADIVVMTTEVLRNMIYAGRDLSDLGVVVIDEVHFLQDAYRGPVWEEVIIHAPAHVQLVCLSATVSNTDELTSWIETVRGPARAIVETRRPVELENMFMLDDRTNRTLRMYRTTVKGEPNPDVVRLDMSSRQRRHGRSASRPGKRQGSGRRQLATPGRIDVIERLAAEQLLPVIFFIFSRNQCSETALAAYRAGLCFTDSDEQNQIRAIAARRVAAIADDDLEALGYDSFLAQLEVGIAAHHAGMVPPFKEIVEQTFIAGLVKVVFATETLAVGVNMPARTVVIDKLTKFTGEHHESLSPAQYSQLTGRAGRRGLDDKGTAVVLWSPFVRFDQVADLALSRSFHLRSAFRPTYNMAANLVRTYDRTTARQLLTLSFAQFQADRDVVKFERRLRRKRERLERLLAEAESPYGDIHAYRSQLAGIGGPRQLTDATERSLAELRPGELIHASKGKFHGPVAVVATSFRKKGLKATTITPSGHLLHLTADDFDAPPAVIGEVVLPGAFSPNQRGYRDEVGTRIKQAKLREPRRRRGSDGEARPGAGLHPVESDPDLSHRLRTLDDADSVRAEVEQLERRVESQNATLAREFDAVLAVLDQRGYVDERAWRLTDAGEMLARLFHESDLLVAEALRAGLFDGLDAPSLAGLASTLVYEHRSPDDPPAPWFPNNDVRDRWHRLGRISDELARLERARHLTEHRGPDPTFFAVAYAWVSGDGFADIVDADELTGGDFVRTIKQLVDLLRQFAQVATDPGTRAAATAAIEAANRGVVADTSRLDDLGDR